MPECERQRLASDRVRVLGFGNQIRAAEVLVQIGAADSAELGRDFYVVGLRYGGGGDGFQADVALAVETDGCHGGGGGRAVGGGGGVVGGGAVFGGCGGDAHRGGGKGRTRSVEAVVWAVWENGLVVTSSGGGVVVDRGFCAWYCRERG